MHIGILMLISLVHCHKVVLHLSFFLTRHSSSLLFTFLVFVKYQNSVLTVSLVFAVKNTDLLPVDKGMEFDPIRQHRHFCPWITSTSGGVPGWQQVLSALQRQKEVSHSSPTSPPATLLIKVTTSNVCILVILV